MPSQPRLSSVEHHDDFRVPSRASAGAAAAAAGPHPRMPSIKSPTGVTKRPESRNPSKLFRMLCMETVLARRGQVSTRDLHSMAAAAALYTILFSSTILKSVHCTINTATVLRLHQQKITGAKGHANRFGTFLVLSVLKHISAKMSCVRNSKVRDIFVTFISAKSAREHHIGMGVDGIQFDSVYPCSPEHDSK
jgi:hypothetical protein